MNKWVIIGSVMLAIIVAFLLGGNATVQLPANPTVARPSTQPEPPPQSVADAGSRFGRPVGQSAHTFGALARSAAEAKDLAAEIESLLASVPSGGDETLLLAKLDQLIAVNVEKAASLIEALEPGERRTRLRRQVLHAWVAQDVDGAAEWANRLPDPGERSSALGEICMKFAESDPAFAVQMAERFEVGALPGLLENLVQGWSEVDFPATAAWIEKQPPSESRDQLVARAAFTQARQDPVAAGKWLIESTPPGRAQSEAVISVVHQWAMRDLPAARAWVEQFPEGDLRARAEREVAGISQQQEQLNAQ